MIPSSFIQDLLARTDVVDIVGRHVTLKKAGINFKGLCPFHGEKSPSFVVSPSRQTYHCFGCGVHGNAIGFLMEHAGLGFVEAVRDLAQIQGMPVPEERGTEEERDKARQIKERQQTITEVLGKAAQHWRRQLKASPRAIDYLKGRGLTGEIAARFALGYAPEGWKGLASAFPRYDDPVLVEAGLVIVPEEQPEGDDEGQARRYDRFRDRIMFPIRSVQGDVIGFGGRVLDKGEPKYLNSPETPVFSKGRELYGLYEARTALRNKGYVIVTEGYMDVVALAQWGFANAVATLGTACTAEHVQKLLRFTEQVVFSFDGDAAGRRAAGRALEAALPHATDTRRISFLFLPADHDPDSYIREHGADAFEQCVRQAVPLSRQIIQHAGQDCDLDTAEGRARLLAQALPLLAQLPEGALRDQIAVDLADQARAPADDVRKRLELARGAAQARAAGPSSRGPQEEARPEGGHPDGGWTPRAEGDFERHSRSGGYESGGSSDGGAYRGKGKWRREGGAWQRHGRPASRPLPQAARPLERAAWVLIRRSDLWEQLPSELHDLLCDQPAPLGAFFCWLDRLVAGQGPVSAAEIAGQLGVPPAGHAAGAGPEDGMPNAPCLTEDGAADPALAALAQRLAHFHEVENTQHRLEDLVALVRPLQLQSLNDELELLLQSGELSDVAEARKLELLRQTNALKLEISRSRPISG